MKKYLQQKKAASLIELLVTMGIMIILLTMITNIFTQIIRINLVVKERAYVRDVTASLLNQISKDIKGADTVYIENCLQNVVGTSCTGSSLILTQQASMYKWEITNVSPNGTLPGYYPIKYRYDYDDNEFVKTYDPVGLILLKSNNIFTILLNQNDTATSNTPEVDTLSGVFEVKLIGESYRESSTEAPVVTNVVKQTVVATRNYKL